MRYDFYIWTERDGSDAVDIEREKEKAIKILADYIDRSWLIQEAARLTDDPVWHMSSEELLRVCEGNRTLYDIITEYDDIDYLDLEYGDEDKLDEVKDKARGECHYDSWNDYWIEEHWGR